MHGVIVPSVRTVIVMAKAPEPGRVKTRLCPPCTPELAARLARAALLDTIDAVVATPNARPVLAIDGEPGPWLPAGVEVIPQRGSELAERLGHAFVDAGTGGLLIGMDTPQVTPTLLRTSLDVLATSGVDGALGPSADGGWWAIGLRVPDPAVFVGVPMSTHRTHDAQQCRLRELRLQTTRLPALRDADFYDDAWAVARAAPGTRFAAELHQVAR